MCGLFGFVNYSNKDIKGLSDLTNALAEHSSVRGTDATGISFITAGIVRIIVKRWTQRCRNWDVVLNYLKVMFEDRTA